jgi:hypothetical protein
LIELKRLPSLSWETVFFKLWVEVWELKYWFRGGFKDLEFQKHNTTAFSFTAKTTYFLWSEQHKALQPEDITSQCFWEW